MPETDTKYVSTRSMPVNSGDPELYEETPTTVKIAYQKKGTQ